MGQDKAMLELGGRPLVALAVEKLKSFCAEVAISGNREDLKAFAPVVAETRLLSGPAAGIEAALASARCSWALFIPVDVPLVPAALLRAWVSDVLGQEEAKPSWLMSGETFQPTFCLLPKSCADVWSRAVEGGDLRVLRLLAAVGAQPYPVRESSAELERWFMNVNTPEELERARAY